jgi:hypothetical protein
VPADTPARAGDVPAKAGDKTTSFNRREEVFEASKELINKLKTPVTAASLRLWKLIFLNVCRSVDELYQFCEEESSGELCEQSFQFFLCSCRDFAQLSQRIEREKNDALANPGEKVAMSTHVSNEL